MNIIEDVGRRKHFYPVVEQLVSTTLTKPKWNKNKDMEILWTQTQYTMCSSLPTIDNIFRHDKFKILKL